MDAFLARRAILTGGLGARSLQILGSRFSPEALRLRQFVARQRLPHAWEDLEERADVEELLARAGVEPSDIPVVITPTGVLRRPTPADLADALGLSYRPSPDDRFDMAVVGGGNSAGQAAMFLAEHAGSVRVLVRRNGLADTMSRYLVDRIEARPRITVCPRTQVTGVHGDQVLRQVSTVDAGGLSQTEDCAGLFCFIGADAGTGWLPPEVRLGAGGFVLTDRDLRQEGQPSDGRDPLPYESSVPGVFAVGDVRHGSTKRVAAAVGEGGSAVHSAHRYLAAHRHTGR